MYLACFYRTKLGNKQRMNEQGENHYTFFAYLESLAIKRFTQGTLTGMPPERDTSSISSLLTCK